MPISIVHIGLPLDHPSIPPEDRPELTARLATLKQTMQAAGYDYQIVHASPATGLDDFRQLLRTHPCDGVMLGGGVVGNPELSYFLEQIINATHEAAPLPKIMFYNHTVDVRTIVERWLPSSSTNSNTSS